MRCSIGSKNNAVLVLVKELACGPWLPAQLIQTGGDVYVHVGEAIEILRNVFQVFGEVADMQSDKVRLRVARKHSIPCFQNFRVGGEPAAEVRPIRVIVQFLVTLIEAIRWREKCQWIRYVNGDGHLQAGTSLPHRVESGIIHLHQFAAGCLLAQREAEGLQNLEATSTRLVGGDNSVCLQLRILRLEKQVIRGFGERIKARRKAFVVLGDRTFEASSKNPR